MTTAIKTKPNYSPPALSHLTYCQLCPWFSPGSRWELPLKRQTVIHSLGSLRPASGVLLPRTACHQPGTEHMAFPPRLGCREKWLPYVKKFELVDWICSTVVFSFIEPFPPLFGSSRVFGGLCNVCKRLLTFQKLSENTCEVFVQSRKVCTWWESDDGCIRVGPLNKVGGDLCRALTAVAAHGGLVADVAAAVHRGRDLTVALLSCVHRLAELDLGHCQSKGEFDLLIQNDKQ